MTDADLLAERFQAARPRLTAIATRLLSTSADAEDAVQETWLRLRGADAGSIENVDAWLTTVLSRICLDQLRTPRRLRERSWEVTPWPAEPRSALGDPAAEAEQGEQVAAALLLVLDALRPAERIAFVLHDVFGRPFDEVADALGRSPEAARQLASRARRRLHGSGDPKRPDAHRARPLVDAWLQAAQQGDVSRLLTLLDEDATLHADYGATQQRLSGRQQIAEQAVLSARLAAHSTPVLLGGRPGVAAVLSGRVVSVMAFEIEHDRILRLDVLADPGRLAGLGVARVLEID